MKRRRRVFMLFIVLAVAASAVAAETLAVLVRPMSDYDDPQLNELLLAAEEGAMETMFAQGHIVFDLELDDEMQLSLFQAIDSARFGGARFFVLIDCTFRSEPPRGLVPEAMEATVVDVELETETRAESVDPGSIPGAAELPSDALATIAGQRAAERALRTLREVQAAW